ncbi:MAG: hypothetical protein J7L45_01900 [Candidatus Aenigmarchaeota archaeon]|nr:hypothetical protein [Candidatus Aenigmarchaeota archaeon]
MEINSKQLWTILIAFIFIGSTVGFAMNYKAPMEKTSNLPKNIFDRPLSDSERSYFINSDSTVLTLFFLPQDNESMALKKDIEDMSKSFGEKLIIEEVNVNTFQSFTSEYHVMFTPTIIIRGKANENKPIRIEGETDLNVIKEDICSTYESSPSAC